MFARFDRMAKQFTRIGKEIAIAVKQSGPNPENNAKLRTVMQNAKSVNMPKDRVDAAIKRASSKGDSGNYEEVRFEGYAPHGVGVLAVNQWATIPFGRVCPLGHPFRWGIHWVDKIIGAIDGC